MWKARAKCLTLIAMLVTMVGFPLMAGDLREWNYQHWSQMSHGERLRFVEGIMVGAWAMTYDLAFQNLDNEEMVLALRSYSEPYENVTSAHVVETLNVLYSLEKYRDVPIYAMIRQRDDLVQGELDGFNGETEQGHQEGDQRSDMREGEDREDNFRL